MIYPSWLFYLWLVSAIANMALAVTITRLHLQRAWISLLLAAVCEVVAFAELQKQPYPRYYAIFTWHVAAQALFRLTVLGDILRALPGGSLMPSWLKASITTLAIAAAAGVCLVMLHGNSGGDAYLNLKLLDATGKVAWAAMTMFLLYGVAFSGFNFTETGVRIATAYIVRILIGMGTAAVYLRHASFATMFRLSGIDTAAGLWFALYCTYAMVLNDDTSKLTADQASEVDAFVMSQLQ